MVSSGSSQAFFGLPPKGLRPKQLEEPHLANSSRYPFRSREPRPNYVDENDNDDDWSDVFGASEEEMEVDLPHRVTSCQRPDRDVEQQEPSKSTRSSAVPNDPESNTIHLAQSPDDPILAENVLDIVRLQVGHCQMNARLMLTLLEGSNPPPTRAIRCYTAGVSAFRAGTRGNT